MSELGLMRSLIAALALCLVCITSAAAQNQDSGVIYCGSHASPNFVVPVRLEPGRGLLVENASCDQQIAVLGIEQGYAKIKTWYSTGYVSLEFVQLAAKPLKPAVSFDRAFIDCEEPIEVPVYSNVQAKSVITNLTCSQPVSFIDMEYGYVRIRIADRIGYVAAKFIKVERSNTEPMENPDLQAVISFPACDVNAAPQQEERQSQASAPMAIVPAEPLQDPSKAPAARSQAATYRNSDAQKRKADPGAAHSDSHQ